MNFDIGFKDIYKESVKFDLKKLLTNLKCYICKGIYRNPHTINECAHSFCKACIYKFFLSNKKFENCPQCNTKIGGRPFDALIFDNSLNTLINIIFPEFDQIETKLSEVINKLLIKENSFLYEESTFEGKVKLRENYNDCLLIYIEPDETFEYPEEISFPAIHVPYELNTILLKKFIVNQLNLGKDENQVLLIYNNCIIDYDNTFDNLRKLYGLGGEEKTIIKFSLKEYMPND